MAVRFVSTGVKHLAADLGRVPARAGVTIAAALAESAREGNSKAQEFARASSGKIGRHYPESFRATIAGLLAWEYGPDASMPQGGMSFEHGSRKQPPHLDLAKSADLIVPTFQRRVSEAINEALW